MFKKKKGRRKTIPYCLREVSLFEQVNYKSAYLKLSVKAVSCENLYNILIHCALHSTALGYFTKHISFGPSANMTGPVGNDAWFWASGRKCSCCNILGHLLKTVVLFRESPVSKACP